MCIFSFHPSFSGLRCNIWGGGLAPPSPIGNSAYVARPSVTFPAVRRHRPYAGAKLDNKLTTGCIVVVTVVVA